MEVKATGSSTLVESLCLIEIDEFTSMLSIYESARVYVRGTSHHDARFAKGQAQRVLRVSSRSELFPQGPAGRSYDIFIRLDPTPTTSLSNRLDGLRSLTHTVCAACDFLWLAFTLAFPAASPASPPCPPTSSHRPLTKYSSTDHEEMLPPGTYSTITTALGTIDTIVTLA